MCRTRTLRRLLIITSISAALSFSGGKVPAQSSNGNITGIVKDSGGAVVTNADVSLTTAQRVVLRSTKADAQGRFT